MAFNFGFARGEGGGGSGYPSTSVFGQQPADSGGGGAGGRGLFQALGPLNSHSRELYAAGRQQQPLTPFGETAQDPLTAALQARAVGADPLGLQQRRAIELMRRRRVLLNGLGTGLQGTVPAPNRAAITRGQY